jgi:hypothetical protein
MRKRQEERGSRPPLESPSAHSLSTTGSLGIRPCKGGWEKLVSLGSHVTS